MSTEVATLVDAAADAIADELGIHPQGFYILVEMVKAPRKIGMLHRPEDSAAREDLACPLARVIRMGPDCFMTVREKPVRNGTPRCYPGDYVIVNNYTGNRIRLTASDADYRLITDDCIQARVDNPERIRRSE